MPASAATHVQDAPSGLRLRGPDQGIGLAFGFGFVAMGIEGLVRLPEPLPEPIFLHAEAPERYAADRRPRWPLYPTALEDICCKAE
jgi:hypothetical protein